MSSWTPKWHKDLSQNVWKVAEPLARAQLLKEQGAIQENPELPFLLGESSIVVNDRLGALAWSVIGRRPLLYLKWIFDSYRSGLNMFFDCKLVRQFNLLLLLSVPAVLIKASSKRSQMPRPHREVETSSRALFIFGLCLIAVAYFLVKLGLTIMVNQPDDRFMVSAFIYLPSAFAICLFEIWRWIAASD